MSQDRQLYESAQVWNQGLQAGQKNLMRAIRDFALKAFGPRLMSDAAMGR